MLVHQERDPQAAEAFCRRAAQGRDSQFRQTLLLILLQIYLSSEDLISVAVDLLNNNPRVFEVEQVIRLLPDSWSVQLVSQFLIGSLRETLHQRRMARLQKELSQAELMQHKVIWVSLTPYLCVCSLFPCFSELYCPFNLSSADAGLKNKIQTGQGAEVHGLSERPCRATYGL